MQCRERDRDAETGLERAKTRSAPYCMQERVAFTFPVVILTTGTYLGIFVLSVLAAVLHHITRTNRKGYAVAYPFLLDTDYILDTTTKTVQKAVRTMTLII